MCNVYRATVRSVRSFPMRDDIIFARDTYNTTSGVYGSLFAASLAKAGSPESVKSTGNFVCFSIESHNLSGLPPNELLRKYSLLLAGDAHQCDAWNVNKSCRRTTQLIETIVNIAFGCYAEVVKMESIETRERTESYMVSTLRTPWSNCYRTATASELIWLRRNVTGGRFSNLYQRVYFAYTNLANDGRCTIAARSLTMTWSIKVRIRPTSKHARVSAPSRHTHTSISRLLTHTASSASTW